jgi:hypothetical protein
MMEFWTKVAALAAVGQVLVLIATALFVWWYLQETAELRRTAQQQLEAQIRPALTVVSPDGQSLLVSNIGSGAALNLRLVRTAVESLDWEAESNFGDWAKELAVAVDQVVDTGSVVGSIGNLKGEHLQLIYEGLSGKIYASVVRFNEGTGQPLGVSFLTKE